MNWVLNEGFDREKRISIVIKSNGLGQRFGTQGLGLGMVTVCSGCVAQKIHNRDQWDMKLKSRWRQTMENTSLCG